MTNHIAVITASTRNQRMGPAITDWVTTAIDRDTHIDRIDLAKITLPDDSGLYPGGSPETDIARRIDAAHGYVIVTPEYNHSYPASLKRLIDWHYREWMLKPATIVSYGVHGGHAATEHLRGVLAELTMVTTRRSVGLPAPWEHLDDTGRYTPADTVTQRLTGALAELTWWTGVLTDARTGRPYPH